MQQTTQKLSQDVAYPIARIDIVFKEASHQSVWLENTAHGLVLNIGSGLLLNLISQATIEQCEQLYQELLTTIAAQLNIKLGEIRKQAQEELKVFEDQSQWNITSPALFQIVLNSLNNVCKITNSTMPQLIAIATKKPNSFQALAIINSGITIAKPTSTIIFGKGFLEKYLLDENLINYDTFKWTTAHELGHLQDRTFQYYSKYRFVILQIINICIQTPIFLYIYQKFGYFLNYTHLSLYSGVFIPLAIQIVQLITLVIIHKKFEYSADAYTKKLNLLNHAETAEVALTSMTNRIKEHYSSELNKKINYNVDSYNLFLRPAIITLRIINHGLHKVKFIYKKLTISVFHPSIKNRIARIKNW